MTSAMLLLRRSLQVFALSILGWGCIVLLPSSASADRKEEAHQASERGDRAYAKADYAKALAEYTASYGKSAKPYLLFRIGECHRMLSHGPEAIASYEKFVAKASRGGDRAKARRYLADLKAADGGKSAERQLVDAKPVPQASDVEAPPMTPAEAAKKRLEDEKRAKLLRDKEPKVSAKAPLKSETAPPGFDPANLVRDPSDPISPEDIVPTYKKWWVWTIVGGVVVVGVAIGVGLAFGLPKFQSELPVGGPGASALKVNF